MVYAVLLAGELTAGVLARAEREIRNKPPGEPYCLVVKSPGGALGPSVNFAQFLMGEGGRDLTNVKIYEASSAAALIALAAVAPRSMPVVGEIAIHRGCFEHLEATAIDFETGQVSGALLEQLRQYESLQRRVLGKCGELEDLMLQLNELGWVRLAAKECLDRGLVQELF